MSPSLADMRRDYTRDGLTEAQAPADPYALFGQWFEEAVRTEQPPVEANACWLATVDDEGQPHCRVLLLKGVDAQGFVFYTNYDSAKGQQMAAQPRAAMTFFWPALERQVRIEGRVEQVSAEESDAYYRVRPLAVAWVPGPRRRARPSPIVTSWSSVWPRCSSASPTVIPAGRRSGVAIASSPSASNSGRGVPAASTIGWITSA